MHAIILAGGFGTRLRHVVSDVPKPLAPIAGRPFLDWLLDALQAGGVTSATLSVHHQWEKIRDYFSAHPPSIPLDYAVETVPLGTGGAIAYALQQAPTNKPVIILNGDTFVRVDYRALYEQHLRTHARMTMALRKVEDTGRYGEVVVDNNIVTSFKPGTLGRSGLINAGIYVMSPDFFEGASVPKSFSFEQDFLLSSLPEIAPEAYITQEYFIDIGIPEDYARANIELPQMLSKREASSAS